MNEITTHRTLIETKKVKDAAGNETIEKVYGGFNQLVMIEPADEKGPGGACCKYQLWLRKHGEWHKAGRVEFQMGDPAQYGPNGITNECLLAIVIERLKGFQEGPNACNENGRALAHLESGLDWLHKRTRDRVKRGVDGKVGEK